LVPFNRTIDLKPFFTMLESPAVQLAHNLRKLKANIKDWGLSHPTLEEVFLKLTR